MNYRQEKIVSIVIIIISLLIIAIVAVFALSADKPEAVRDGTEEYSVMPDLAGYGYDKAVSDFEAYFSVVMENEEYSDKYPKGTVISQSVEAGTEFPSANTTVYVTVSKGAKPEETTATSEPPPETETAAEITTETTAETAEAVRTDGPIENPAAEFEKYIPLFELELTAVAMEIPEEGQKLRDELYATLRRHGADAGFLYYDPQTGGSLEYNADERFSAGSIIKAVYARSILGADIDLEAEYEMTEETLNSPYELVKGQPVGTFFSVRELIREALVKSDNTAYKMLYNYIGYDKFNSYAAGLGLRQRMTADNYWFRLTARESAIYFKDIYAFSKQHVNGEFMLECMADSEYREMFGSALPDKTVAEKYGYLPQEDFYTLGDCAVISGDTDYILVAYVRNTGENLDTKFFRDVAEITDKIHELTVGL